MARQDLRCTVCEAEFDAEKRGAGINLLPHATAALDALGVLPELEQLGVPTKTLTYIQEIWSEKRGRWAGHDCPQISIHRGVLHATLLRAVHAQAGENAVRLGHRLLHASHSNTGITARFEVGKELVDIEADAIIGADGLHSALRRQLVPEDGGIKWSGITIWRGIADWPIWRGGDHMLCAGDMQKKLIFYPIGSGSSAARRLTNWALCARLGPDAPLPPKEHWSQHAVRRDVAARSGDFSIPELDVEALIEATPEIFEFPMADRDPLPSWTSGRMTLLGDAAHPMYPTGSNGAAQAILNSVCLTRNLKTASDIKMALMAYEMERRPATEAIVLSNRQGGPERVVDIVSARAPNGFTRIEVVVHRDELAAIGLDYARKSGVVPT